MKVIERVLSVFTGTLLFATIVMTLLQILFRYFLDRSLAGVEELTRVCFVWFILVGAPLSMMRSDDHMKVSILTSKLSPRASRYVGIVSNSMVAALSIVLFLYGIQLTKLMSRQTFAAFSVPMSYLGAAIPVGSLFLIVVSLGKLARCFRLASREEEAK